MARNDTTSAIIDSLLQVLIVGGLLATTLAAPNAIQALDKPLTRYFKVLDKRTREREYRRVLRYMKKQGLIKYSTEDYEHGIQITKAGIKRAKQADLDRMNIVRPKSWDEKWRIVFFDIPETDKQARDHFTGKLKALGFRKLQRSVWVHPFPCRDEIATVTHQYDVSRFVTYIETSFIDSQEKLKVRFPFKF